MKELIIAAVFLMFSIFFTIALIVKIAELLIKRKSTNFSILALLIAIDWTIFWIYSNLLIN